MVERIARISYRRRRRMVVGWVVGLIALMVIGGAFGGDIVNNFTLPDAESQHASDLLEARGFAAQGGDTGQIVFKADAPGGMNDASVKATVEKLVGQVRDQVKKVKVVSPYDAEARGQQIAPGGKVGYAEVQFGAGTSFDDATALGKDITKVRDDFGDPKGVQIELGGQFFQEQDQFSSEGIGFLAAMVILLIAFGSLLAMGLPLLTALFGILSGMAIVQLFMHVLDIPDFAPATVAMIAIGVGIDYALFIVTRYREELGAGRDPEAAVVRSLSTAGRAVLFAGSTVVIAMLGLLVFPTAVTQSLAITISAGVLMVMIGSLTLLPALLGFAGHNIDKLSIHRKGHVVRSGEASIWYRWSRVIQRRPWFAALGGLAILLVLAVPVLSMRLGFGDSGNRPTSDTTRRAYDIVSTSFGPGYNGPLILAVDLPGSADQTQQVSDRLTAALNDDPNVAHVVGPFPNDKGDTAFVRVDPKTSPQDEATSTLVQRLRDKIAPAATAGTTARVLVGGGPAVAIDYADFQAERLPLFMGMVLVLSFLLLMAVFRSVLVPLKAVVMNLLSIGAAYGVLVAVFQKGWGASALGLGKEGPIESWAPMMLFAIIFGLSMDYEVFLLTRMKEEYNRTGDNATAVADGLARTARLITAAAAIMFCVFAGFFLSSDRALQLFGAGLAVAVLIDATIVRLVLVPATMELLGDRNWWIPRWLDRILPHIDVEGPEDAALEPESPPAPVPGFAPEPSASPGHG